ncbi:MAG: ATP synthase F1 subunit delta, partial [Desulfobulbaceae bacterium]|nr:ATP synthase F1 subunit delta [Desulfobulbaceae bacterium]
KRRADVLPDIADVFQEMVDEEQGISRGSVITAFELSDELKNKIQDKLEKVAGKKVIVTTQIDSSIIGGMIAKVGDLVLDGSIKSQLAGLKESIKGSE